jgi:zinc transport system substrate-binding protein
MAERIAGYLFLAIAASVVACGEGQRTDESAAGAEDGMVGVYTVNYPLQYFAEKIGGEYVDVQFPAPSDVDPAYWQPDAETIAAYQSADLILLNGASYAQWVDLTTLPSSKLVNTSEPYEDRYIELEDVVTHSHGPEGEHAHGDLAFTTWLDPTLAIEQARAIQQALAAARPEHATAFQQNFESLERELTTLDGRLEQAFARVPDRALVTSHPVYQYMTRRYGLDARSVHFEPGEYPDADGWRGLEGITAEHPAVYMLWEGEPEERTAAQLEGMGLAVVVFDPCGHKPAQGDYISVMKMNVRSVEAALRR